MNTLRKYVYHLLGGFVLALLLLAGLLLTAEEPAEAAGLLFELETKNGTEEIGLYRSPEGHSYVFLPSFAQMQDLRVRIPRGSQVLLEGKTLADGASCGDLIPGTAYTLSMDGSLSTLLFCRGENTAALFLDTASGSMENVHRNKTAKEYAALSLYTPDGSTDYRGEGDIKGRGNTTWRSSKKPYTLSLDTASELLGMGRSAEWVLLANAFDESNLRNKLVYDTVNRLSPGFAPESRHVDVYLNGEYAGLYLLSEKVAAQADLPLLQTENGDFLCTLEIISRMEGLPNAFQTDKGRGVEIVTPEVLTEDSKARIQSQVNRMEAAILSGDADALAGCIDLDSWVLRYLADEIFANADSDKTSSYFYCSDGIFYAGPLWDYDLSFGYYLEDNSMFSDPHMFVTLPLSTNENAATKYNYALYHNDVFYERMTRMYQENFLPLLTELVEGGLEEQYRTLAASAEMNRLRWSSLFDTTDGDLSPAEEMTEYLRARLDFLSSAWIDGVEYHALRFYSSSGDALRFTAVARGSLIDPSLSGRENAVWLDRVTGEEYDFSRPILSDTRLIAKAKNTPAPEADAPESPEESEPAPAFSLKSAAVGLSLLLAALLLLLLLITDRRRTRERKP